jgi:hypothetical protein
VLYVLILARLDTRRKTDDWECSNVRSIPLINVFLICRPYDCNFYVVSRLSAFCSIVLYPVDSTTYFCTHTLRITPYWQLIKVLYFLDSNKCFCAIYYHYQHKPEVRVAHSNLVLTDCLGWTFLMAYSKAKFKSKGHKHQLVTDHPGYIS